MFPRQIFNLIHRTSGKIDFTPIFCYQDSITITNYFSTENSKHITSIIHTIH